MARSTVKTFGLRMFLLGCLGWVVAPSDRNVFAAEQANIDFTRDIRPILESRGYECHGPKKQKSGLRLDRKSHAFRGGDSGKPAIIANQSSESPLLQKITSQDPDEMMPPKGERLTAAQVSALRAWIERDAIWPEAAEKKHWAYVKPVRPALPKVQDKKWPRNGLDYFVLARLEKEKVTPSPPADRATLIRPRQSGPHRTAADVGGSGRFPG